MRTRAWRLQQKRNKRHKTPTVCSCWMCSPGRYGELRHTDLKKTHDKIRDLEERYLAERDEEEAT